MKIESNGMIREAVLAELERRGVSRAWLARQVGIAAPAVCRMLRPGGSFRTAHAEAMFEALELWIVGKDDDT